MEITPVLSILGPSGFGAPALRVLVANETNYRALLMQPAGQIEASAAGVFNRDRELARRQFGRFLHDARDIAADLAITPEYALPWETLIESIEGGVVPSEGQLWVLGCESIKYGSLEALKTKLAPSATLFYENLAADPDRFTDPLVYVFLAPSAGGKGDPRLVLLVQFKTYPMGDKDHFEANGLQRGTKIYEFGGVGPTLKLVTLICSDAFAFTDAHATAIYKSALVIHIQLNQKPRQDTFRQYRDRLLGYQGDETELICLNWARNVDEWSGGKQKPWKNISGSAWYLKPDKFDDRDATLCANHRRGMYYTWLAPLHTHALFFNFEPATFHLEATKVAHVGVKAVVSRRRGPQLTKVCVWNDGATAWTEQVAADDGFSAVVAESGNAQAELVRVASVSPLAAERVLALCAGRIGPGGDWHKVQVLDSCVIESTEVIRRLTFCQDTDPRARDFRVARLRRCAHLWDIASTPARLPPALADLKKGFRLEWSEAFPHQNIISNSGDRATLIYMGEEAGATQIDETARYAAEHLGRASSDPDVSLLAKQRLAVWSRHHDDIVLYDQHRYTRIDQPRNASEFDVAREE